MVTPGKTSLNHLSPSSDKHPFSPYNIITWSNVQVVRKREMITKEKNVLIFKEILPTSAIIIILRKMSRM